MKHLFIFLFFVFFYTAVQAQPGTLDKSYGEGGKVIDKDTLHNAETPVAVQSDGKILVGGSGYYQGIITFALHRYMPDGSPDLSFGTEGIAYALFKGMADPASDGANITGISIQPDCKIVAAGHASINYSDDVGLAKFNTNGTLDSSFGANGTIQSVLGNSEFITCMTLQPDGKIVVAGEDVTGNDDGESLFFKFLTARYLPDGQLDKSFGEGGKVISSKGLNAKDIVLQPDGRIVVAGYTGIGLGYLTNFYMERYMPDGSPDKSFGIDGSVETDLGFARNLINSIALQTDGKIVAAGESNASDRFPDIAVVRYNNDGTLDEAFGKGGKVITLLPKLYTSGRKVLLSNKNIIIAGLIYNLATNNNDYMVAGYTSDGSLDSSFGINGIIATDMGSISDNLNSAALQPDGKIVVAGYVEGLIPNIDVRGIARYNGYDPGKQPLMVRIKRWLLHHGISWQAEQSKDVRYYAVQRSADGIVYKEIAKLSNKAQVDKYEDATITGSSYYRLAAIGWDGSRTYSNTVLIDESTNVKVFPNPVRDNLQLQGLSGKTSVSVVDLQGNVRSSSVAGGATYSINTSQLTPGNYLLKLQHNNVTTTLPFVKE